MNHQTSIFRIVVLISSVTFTSLIAQTQQTPGTWQNVTPSGLDVSSSTGVMSVAADPVRKNEVYFFLAGQGVYKSTNYGDSWTKVNTGANGDKVQSGAPWYVAFDPNPNRDPSIPLTLYVEQGYGAGGVWKSTDGGVSWNQVWNNNIYAPDGVTNISCDVGSDCAAFAIVSPNSPNHLILSLHSIHNGYSGCGTDNNNGVFESTDGGGKWIVHRPNQTFNFVPHSDCLFPINENTWCVSTKGGDLWPNAMVYRTTDRGTSWSESSGLIGSSGGRSFLTVGNTHYAGSPVQGFHKSTDNGATWTRVGGYAGTRWTGWIAATATRLYISTNSANDARYYSAPVNNDSQWTALPNASARSGYFAVSTFDGQHYSIIVANENGGVWRYVEPAVTTVSLPGPAFHSIAPAGKRAGFVLQNRMVLSNQGRIFDVKGRNIRIRKE